MAEENGGHGKSKLEVLESETLPHLASPYKGEVTKEARLFRLLAFCQRIDKQFHPPSIFPFIDTPIWPSLEWPHILREGV